MPTLMPIGGVSVGSQSDVSMLNGGKLAVPYCVDK